MSFLWVPYQRIWARSLASPGDLTKQLRGAFDQEAWAFCEHNGRFVIRRKIGWGRMPGLPLARGTLTANDATTDVRITVRLSWPVCVVGGLWMSAAMVASFFAMFAATRTASPKPLLAFALPVGGWLLLLRPFSSESKLIRERLASVLPNQNWVLR